MSFKANRTANEVLIVDGDKEILALLIDILQDEIGVSYAPSGAKALERAHLHKPDLILLAVEMPGMDGFEVCMRLKSDPETQDIPVIFLTGMSDEKHVVEGLRLGAVDYITKPFDPNIVIAKVKNHLEQIMALRDSKEGSLAPAEDHRRQGRHGERRADRPAIPFQRTAAPGREGNRQLIMVMAFALILLLGGGAYWGVKNYIAAPLEERDWPLSSKCESSPVVSWWGTTTHFSIVDYVNRKHDGDWAPYIDKWTNQRNKLRDIYKRGSSAAVSGGVVLSDVTLKSHIDKLEKRISIIHCLAAEARTLKRN